MTVLRLVLGDQLSPDIASLEGADKQADMVLMSEVWQEATYVRHHKKKLVLIFSAMRHFAQALEASGFHVRYTRLDDAANAGSLAGEVARALHDHAVDRIVVTAPGEYRLWEEISGWQARFGVPVSVCPDTRFLCSTESFSRWARGRKRLKMEPFYREMRVRHQVLMQEGAPVGGQWNYDHENRQSPPRDLAVPPPFTVAADAITREVMTLVATRFANHFGELEPFSFAVTRADAQAALAHFLRHRLARFGDYQDAMVQGEPWMYHAHLSPYLNCGLLQPLECIRAAEAAYSKGEAPLNAVEGFVRQVLGWREFIRGIYWHHMPDYANVNTLNATRPLPDFYWTGATDMHCLRQCVEETRRHAYAHHIQRLMVLGNFALLAGLDPAEVNTWYLIVYADAYEWVELPNVTGMALYADGGTFATKPYAASGAYINKMSDYCQHCRYRVAVKHGPEACPFNYLYWDFLARNRENLGSNPRLSMAYKTYDRMREEKKYTISEDSARFLTSL